MDTESRVLRVDSLSKSIAPGMRLGWISGPAEFVEKSAGSAYQQLDMIYVSSHSLIFFVFSIVLYSLVPFWIQSIDIFSFDQSLG